MAARGGRWLQGGIAAQGGENDAAWGQGELLHPQRLRKASCDTGERKKKRWVTMPHSFECDVSPDDTERRKQRYSPAALAIPPALLPRGAGTGCHRERLRAVAACSSAPRKKTDGVRVGETEHGTGRLRRQLHQVEGAASISNSPARPTWSHGGAGGRGCPAPCTATAQADSPPCPSFPLPPF